MNKKSSSWIEKYRPTKLNNIIGQEHVILTLNKLAKNKTTIPNLLFYGLPGVGKTTTVLALCLELFGPENINNRVLELNASDERGVDVVRDQIMSFAKKSLSPADPNYPSPDIKIIILDEVDAMTKDAQSALRKIMEDYLNNTRFCLICNYIEKLIKPLLSRCMFFNFKPLKSKTIITHLKKIAERENMNISDKIITNIYKTYNGDLRQAINSLQQLKYFSGQDLKDEIKEKFDNQFYEEIYEEMSKLTREEKIKYFDFNAYDRLKYRDFLINKFRDNFIIVKSLLKYCNIFDY